MENVNELYSQILKLAETIPQPLKFLAVYILFKLFTTFVKKAVNGGAAKKNEAHKAAVKEVANKEEFDKYVADAAAADQVLVADFTATWCGPCQRIAPLYADMSLAFGDTVFLKVDTDKAQDVSKHCDIKCMPTFQFYKVMRCRLTR